MLKIKSFINKNALLLMIITLNTCNVAANQPLTPSFASTTSDEQSSAILDMKARTSDSGIESGIESRIESRIESIINFQEAGVLKSKADQSTTDSGSSRDLRITEVSSTIWEEDRRWIEIHNGTPKAINLADYALKTAAINLDDFSVVQDRVFSLKDKVIAPGSYIIVQVRHASYAWQSHNAESAQLTIVGEADDNIRPWWHENGYVELVNKDITSTIDFVRWGDSVQEPIVADAWVKGESAPQFERELGQSIVRDLKHTDTNTGSDWRYSYFSTPAGDNNITCKEDTDRDNIPDCAEVEGSTFSGLPLYDWGARVGVRDIFIEVDFMKSDDPGIIPRLAALQKVVDVFAEKDFAIHFDVGDLFHQSEGLSRQHFDLGGGNSVPFYPQTLFISEVNAPSLFDHKINNFDLRRRPIFHYLLMANSQEADGSAGSSGYAEILGNDIMISMGAWGFNEDSDESINIVTNMQAATIMHELGHNLGLYHGGDEDVNSKPNHMSIMNYLYQLSGLPEIGRREGDRFYEYFFFDDLNCSLDNNLLVNGPEVPTEQFLMSYSNGKNSTLNEILIDESFGLGHIDSTSVDFNCNGILDEQHVELDINGNGISTDLLRDVDEWSMIDLQFSRQWSGSISGNDLQRSMPIQALPRSRQEPQRKRYIKESAPEPRVLEFIRSARAK